MKVRTDLRERNSLSAYKISQILTSLSTKRTRFLSAVLSCRTSHSGLVIVNETECIFV